MKTMNFVGVDEKAKTGIVFRTLVGTSAGYTKFLTTSDAGGPTTSATVYNSIWDIYREKISSFSSIIRSTERIPPSKIAISFASQLLKSIQSFEIFPLSITAAVDGHIFIRFNRNSSQYIFDIYPEGNIIFIEKVSALVFKTKEISILDTQACLSNI